MPSTAGGYDYGEAESIMVNDEEVCAANTPAMSGAGEHKRPEDAQNLVYIEEEKHVEPTTLEIDVGHSESKGHILPSRSMDNDLEHGGYSGNEHPIEDKQSWCQTDGCSFVREPFLMAIRKLSWVRMSREKLPRTSSISETRQTNASNLSSGDWKQVNVADTQFDSRACCSSLHEPLLESLEDRLEHNKGHKSQAVSFPRPVPCAEMHQSIPIQNLN